MKCKRCPNVVATRGLCKKHYRALDTRLVDGRVVARRIELLHSWGYTLQNIADLTDVRYEALGRIVNGHTKRALNTTAAAVMAIPVPTEIVGASNPRRSPRIPNVGTRRRLQGLVAMGHSQTAIGKELGVTHQAVANWASNDWVTAATAARVRDVFNKLQLIPGTHERARISARNKGWAPAWAWDEDEIDDPKAQPHMVKGLPGDWIPRLHEYRALGLSIKTMAQMEGVSTHAIYKRLERLGNAA